MNRCPPYPTKNQAPGCAATAFLYLPVGPGLPAPDRLEILGRNVSPQQKHAPFLILVVLRASGRLARFRRAALAALLWVTPPLCYWLSEIALLAGQHQPSPCPVAKHPRCGNRRIRHDQREFPVFS